MIHDLINTTCPWCGKGIFTENSQWDDLDGTLHCTNCNSVTKRYKDNFDILDQEIWSLDCVMARWLYPKILYYKIMSCGVPGDFVDNPGTDYEWCDEYSWEEVLTKIITALRLIDEDCTDYKNDAKIDEGLRLFAKYFRGLWF